MKTPRLIPHSSHLISLCMLFALIPPLCGCGGGGGGTSSIPLSGNVTLNPISGITSRVVQSFTVKAYLWNDTTTPIAQVQTDASGHYAISLASDKVGKDVIVIATQSERRGSKIVADLPSSGKNDAHINISSTLTAELISAKARQLNVTNLQTTTVNTIETEMGKMSGLNAVSVGAGGATLPANFADGLVDSSESMTYVKGDKIIQDALAAMTQNGGGISPAKQIVQLLRDTTQSIIVNGKSNKYNMIQETLQTRTQLRTMAQTYDQIYMRTRSLFRLLARTKLNDQTLENMPPGGYVYQQEQSGNWTLSPLSQGGTEWMIRVYDKLPSSEAYYTITITPKNPLLSFKITPDAGEYNGVISDYGVTQSTFGLKFTNNSDKQPIQVDLNFTIEDPNPGASEPIDFAGVMTGVPAGITADGKYLYNSLTLSGTLSSDKVRGNIASLKIFWDTPSPTSADPQRIELTKATLALSQTNNMEMVMENAKMTIGETLKEMECTMTMTTTDLRLKLSNAKLSIVSVPDTTVGSTTYNALPQSLSGDMEYVSPTTTYTGGVSLAWDNPAVGEKQALDTFPTGSVALKGQLKSTLGAPVNVDWKVTSVTTGNTPAITATITQLGDGSQNLAGTIVQPLSITNNIVKPNGPVTMNITASPSNVQVLITAQQNTYSGTIKQGNTSLAGIGPANTLGMPDLGNAAIIKYSDGTFETAASLLPTLQ